MRANWYYSGTRERKWKGLKMREALISLVEVRGFEPPASLSRTKSATRLCYTSIFRGILTLDGGNGNEGW